MLTFTKPFTQREPLPERRVDRAVEILRTGRLNIMWRLEKRQRPAFLNVTMPPIRA